MKKTRLCTLSLFLAFVLSLSVLPISAATTGTATFSYTVNGNTTVYTTITAENGTVVMPEAPTVISGFVGWTATIGGATHLLPAGASCTAVTGNVTFTAVTTDFTTNKGCSVRLLDQSVALRFTSSISVADYENLVALVGSAENISFGTYIVPREYVRQDFTLEALSQMGYLQYVDVPAPGFYKNDDTTATIAGSIGNILENHYTLIYTGVGYMKVTYTNGEVKTIYAAYNRAGNSASVAKTVLNAYEDRNEEYEYLIDEPSGATHSPYSPEELLLCRDFLDDVALIGLDSDENGKYYYFVYKTKYYVSPWSVSSTLDANEEATIVIAPPSGRTVDEIKGIYLDGIRWSLHNTRTVDGKIQFNRSSYLG